MSESLALSLVADVSLIVKTREEYEALDMGARLVGSGCGTRTENLFVRMEREENEESEVAEKAIAGERKKIAHQWSVKCLDLIPIPGCQMDHGPDGLGLSHSLNNLGPSTISPSKYEETTSLLFQF